MVTISIPSVARRGVFHGGAHQVKWGKQPLFGAVEQVLSGQRAELLSSSPTGAHLGYVALVYGSSCIFQCPIEA